MGVLLPAYAECALAGDLGAEIELPLDDGDACAALFGEGPARIMGSAAPINADTLAMLATDHGVPLQRLGLVGGAAFSWRDRFRVELPALRAAYERALSDLTS